MDFVIEYAKEFSEANISQQLPHHEIFQDVFEIAIQWLKTKNDKIKFTSIILSEVNLIFDNHQKKCKEDDCSQPSYHRMITYHLQHKLIDLGVSFDRDLFTKDETEVAASILDKILNDLNEIKNGQEVIFNEINELRDYYFLGKKKWHQLLAGKSFEMLASGIISETVCKQIVEEFSKPIANLLSQR